MALALAFILGFASALGFAPLALWPLTILGFAGLIALVERATSWRRAALTAYLFGLGQFVVGLNWIAGAFRYQDAMPVWLGWIAVVALSIYLAVYPALAGLLAWRFHRRSFAYASAWSAAWIVSEWLRAVVFTGFAWNPIAAIATAGPARLVGIANLAPLVGTYGVSGLIVLGAGLVAQSGEALRARRLTAATALVGLPLLALVALPPLVRDSGRGSTLVRVVQPNIGQQDKHDESFDALNFAKLEALTGAPGAQPRLILWPEAAVPWYLENQGWARRRIASLLGPDDRLLLGGDALVFDRSGEVIAARNSVFALDAGARLHGRYDKAHLVPYGEYLPMRPLLSAIGLSRLVPGDLDFWPGPGPRNLLVAGVGEVGLQVCYEIVFSGQVVDRAHRPVMLFNPSNDAWFGHWGPPQHLAQARLRALEEGLPVVRSTPTGVSAIIDARGRVLAALPLGRAGFLQTRLPAPAAATLFAWGGNIIPIGLALLLAFGAVALARRGR